MIIFSTLWLLLSLLSVLRSYIYSSILKRKKLTIYIPCANYTAVNSKTRKSEPKVEIVGSIARHVGPVQDVSNLMAKVTTSVSNHKISFCSSVFHLRIISFMHWSHNGASRTLFPDMLVTRH